MRIHFITLICLAGMLTMLGCAHEQTTTVSTVPTPPVDGGEALYVSNRAPLAASPLLKLPIGSITPKGWLRHQLVLEKAGMTGRLPEISRWCNFEGNAWADPKGQGHSGWEEMPYWLKGYGDLAYVLKDPEMMALTQRWIEAILATQGEDGWFGPRGLLTSIEGKPDLWPNMIVLNILQSYYEVTSDPRILPFMARYFRWELNYPEKDFMVGYWPHVRAGDNIESIYWLYNRTGEKWLLEVADKCYRRMARWDNDVINWHGVNITQGFRAPAVYSMQSKDPKHVEAAQRNYKKVMELYGQLPGGGFGSDENARPGYDDPRQGFETCSIVEFMHSFQMLTKITANPRWADLCEELAFNTFPAALTPDWKGLHYLTGANQVQLDQGNKAPAIENSGNMFAYSPFERFRCCQHNVSHGWPYYAEELWLATSDRGLCASLYAASEVNAKVADGRMIAIAEETDYPFSDKIKLTIAKLEKPARFPLYLRIPDWCEAMELTMDGQTSTLRTTGPLDSDRSRFAPHQPYLRIDRTWKTGDVITLRLPMNVKLRTWAKNHSAVSVDYGPLTFSLKIGEKWVTSGGKPGWPEQEVFPTTPWNYGLVLDEKNAAASFRVIRNPAALPAQPFTPEAAPLEIRAQARKIPQWKLDHLGLVGLLQESPAYTTEPIETITLIPMGAARLRIAAFPTASDSPKATTWQVPVAPPKGPEASHCFGGDTTAAVNDGQLPKRSNDRSIPRFTWWDHKGTTEWIQYEFDKPRTIKGAEVYWFDDTGTGYCRVPQSWRLLYKAGDEWKPMTSATAYGTARDQFNKATFDAIETTAIRLEVKLQPEYSGGILEWRLID
ncbi:MAG TPA: beta-L-arabinofuranosidase domain-containing protein [Tepidisphaeraceae bacterium]|nr:beta-L-arabinofuranosidase domain-containing protein [Tepidisphaeraceae bacterium]